MENLIEFIDFETNQGGRGRRLAENSFSVWYNLNGKNKMFGVTFSNEIKTDKQFMRVGKLGNDLCLVFTDEKGINIFGKNGKSRKNIVVHSRGFVQMIFPELTEIKISDFSGAKKETGKGRKIFNLKKINDNIFVVLDNK